MNMKNFIIILSLIALISCEKEEIIVFSGITERSVLGEFNGSIDESDWRFDDEWTKKEASLFNITTSYNDSLVMIDKNMGCDVFPNPLVNQGTFSLSAHYRMNLLWVLVNQNFEVLDSDTMNGIFSMTDDIDFHDTTKFQVDEIYRLYYFVDYIDGGCSQGHGDLKVQKR
jgi:hypothetical protein